MLRWRDHKLSRISHSVMGSMSWKLEIPAEFNYFLRLGLLESRPQSADPTPSAQAMFPQWVDAGQGALDPTSLFPPEL
jgi:hypothetical protein